MTSTKKKMLAGALMAFALVATGIVVGNLDSANDLSADENYLADTNAYDECNGIHGVKCEDTKVNSKGEIEIIPDFQKNGVSDEDKVDGVPDAYSTIGLNIGTLGHLELEGLSKETLVNTERLLKLDSDPMSFAWRVGVIGSTGSASDGHITVYLENIKDQDAVRKYLYRGLTAEEIKFVEQNEFLSFDVPENKAKILSLYEVSEKTFWENWTDRFVSADGAINAKAGKITVGLYTKISQKELDALYALCGDYIEVIDNSEYGEIQLFSRTNDTSPHAGGANITPTSGSTSPYCTSAFGLVGKSTGDVYGSTAAHCGNNGNARYSGSYFFGNIAGKANAPSYDTVRLRDSSYEPFLYTDGLDNYTSREVVGANDGAVGTVYCTSGNVTKSNCGAKMTVLDTSYYADNYGWVDHVAKYVPATSSTPPICRPGDSGGPVYTRNTANNRANVKGIISGGNESTGACYASMYYPLSDHLNSHVLYYHTR
jgi:hypothetical protein